MNRKLNILYTIPNFKTAGSQFVLLELYKRIDRAQFQPFVLVEKFPDIFPEEIRHEERLHCSEAVGERSYITKLSKLLKEKNIDILHSWDYKSNSIEAFACKKAGIKYIYTKKNNAWSKRWFAKSFLSTHVVYNNPEMKNRFFSSAFLKNKVSFIPHGVDTSVFKPITHDRPSTIFTVGCIGVIGDNKNQLLVLQALRKLPNNIHVSFYGKEDERYKTKLTTIIKSEGLGDRVSFHGFVANHDIPEVMKTFDVLVLASKNEGLPLSIMEGMACGVAVLSSNSGGGARFLLNDNQGGFIFENEEELVAQLLRLLKKQELRTNLATKGRQRIVDNFSIEKEVDAYKKLYLSLVK